MNQLLAECRERRTRGSGPGGQHRNKVETAVVVEHLPSGLRGEASERRSQQQNRMQAIHRLRMKLALEFRSEPGAEISSLWKSRLQGKRVVVNPEHEDFPALLAEALDVLFACQFTVAEAAARLRVSSSQLVKFLKLQPQALQALNRERQARGEKPLR